MRSDLLRGHLDSLVLTVVEEEPLHGYAIMEALRQRSGGKLDVPTGTLYPALRRLERAGYLRSEWSAVGGRRRRCYQLTGAGSRILDRERAQWREFAQVMDRILHPEAAAEQT